MEPRVVALMPCARIDEIADFFVPLGFAVTYRQDRPYPALALEGHGIGVQYYVIPGHLPESSHSSFLVIVDDPQPLFEEFAAGMRSIYGRLPSSGFPRITRPRIRKNADGRTGFSLIDPAGNWIRVMRAQPAKPSADAAPNSPLAEALLNAIVLGDSKDDPAQAAKILRGAITRADPADPARAEALEYLEELES